MRRRDLPVASVGGDLSPTVVHRRGGASDARRLLLVKWSPLGAPIGSAVHVDFPNGVESRTYTVVDTRNHPEEGKMRGG